MNFSRRGFLQCLGFGLVSKHFGIVPPKRSCIEAQGGEKSHRIAVMPPGFKWTSANLPLPPDRLNKRARYIWDRLVPQMMEARVLETPAQVALVANYCQSYASLQEAQYMLNESSILVRTPGGYLAENPLLSLVRTQMNMVTKLGREIGLSPSSSTRCRLEKTT